MRVVPVSTRLTRAWNGRLSLVRMQYARLRSCMPNLVQKLAKVQFNAQNLFSRPTVGFYLRSL